MAPPVSNSTHVTFGVYELNAQKGVLKKLDRPIRLQPQPFTLLVLLASNPGEIVTREEIQQRIWGDDTFVDFERGLNHCVRQVRAALGYRFIAPVKNVEQPSAEADDPVISSPEPLAPAPAPAQTPGWRRKPVPLILAAVGVLLLVSAAVTYKVGLHGNTATSGRILVAVLPFENLTGDNDQEFLSDGLTDEMIVHLSTISPKQLGVIARTSAMTYKHSSKTLDRISRELGAQYFVEGSVKRIGTKTRITARLVRARDQSQLWTGTYEGEADGKQIPAFQQSVASKVALALSVVLPESRVPVDGSSSQLAYEANLRGRYLLNRRNEDGFHLAIEFFQTAISLDPKYAQAYAGLADCYNLTLDYYERNSGRDLERQARSAAETAIALDPNSSEGHASLAFNLWRYGWKFSEADAEFRKALSLNFNNATAHHWYGLFLASRGRFDEAREELRQARQLDPLSMIIVTNVGWVDYFARDFDGAIANYQEALKLDPSFQTAHMKLAWAYEQRHLWKEALESRQRFYISAGQPGIADNLGAVYARGGYPGAIRAILAETEKADAGRFYDDYEIAKLWAFLGDSGKAVACLERARARHSGWLSFMAVEPAFDNLHTERRFAQMVQEVLSGAAAK